MPLFRKKPVVIEATQWFKHGDHPAVLLPHYGGGVAYNYAAEHGLDVDTLGWVLTLETGHVVSPGDWIITGVQGERYPCKPDIFAATYEAVDA